MGGFFDLNIPQDTSSKATRIKLVVKAMELGYSGIAYNRSIKGIMSDHDRCSIPLLSLSSLLDVAPSLAFSVNFHRDLLGIPRSSPFRQYTRLTVSVDTPSQALVLNSGNPVLKTYDLVAVKPLSQTAFDHACLKSEVDIIAIDFSEKLPIRFNLPMVKAAIERGVYFEITYSGLIADIQVRRQMITEAKLLVDRTRGKNLILTSAASSVNEFRGPYDVANLSSLLGLSMERAKTAISKNCRNLISNALRKKHFYKEAIRIEPISSDEISDIKELVSVDWLKWDPISSGEGDLLLADMEKSFSATTRLSKTAKAIDFSEVFNSMASNQIDNLSSSKGSDVVLCPDNVSMNKDVMEMDVKEQEDIPVTEKVSSSEQLGESGDNSTTIVDYIPLLVAADGAKVENISSVANNLEVMMDEDDTSVIKNVSGREQLKESEDETIALGDHIPLSVTSDSMIVKDVLSVASSENLEKLAVEERQHGDADTRSILVVDDDLKVKDNSSVETCMSLEEMGMRGQMHEEQANVESKHTASVPFLSGKSRANRRTSHQQPSFPLKRLLNPMAFKKKTKKIKRKVPPWQKESVKREFLMRPFLTPESPVPL